MNAGGHASHATVPSCSGPWVEIREGKKRQSATPITHGNPVTSWMVGRKMEEEEEGAGGTGRDQSLCFHWGQRLKVVAPILCPVQLWTLLLVFPPLLAGFVVVMLPAVMTTVPPGSVGPSGYKESTARKEGGVSHSAQTWWQVQQGLATTTVLHAGSPRLTTASLSDPLLITGVMKKLTLQPVLAFMTFAGL